MTSSVESPNKLSAVKATAVKATPVDPTSFLDPTTPRQAQVAAPPVSEAANAVAVTELFVPRDLDERLFAQVYQSKVESFVLSLLVLILILNVVTLMQNKPEEQLLELL
jgi:hypothetical protein